MNVNCTELSVTFNMTKILKKCEKKKKKKNKGVQLTTAQLWGVSIMFNFRGK